MATLSAFFRMGKADLAPSFATCRSTQRNTAATDAGQYDLSVYSANGSLRTFQGDALAWSNSGFARAQICYDPCAGQVYLKVHNSGAHAGIVTVQANAYRSDGPLNFCQLSTRRPNSTLQCSANYK
jgi:hypothetical protein